MSRSAGILRRSLWLGTTAVVLAAVVLAAVVPDRPAEAAREGSQPSGSDAILKRVDVRQNLGAQIPLDLAFRDETGAPIRLQEIFSDKPVILALVYYECPMLCTLVLDGLVKALRAVPFRPGTDFEVVVASFDPGETPRLAAEKKHDTLEKYGTGEAGGWHFLTGDAGDIRALTEAVGFAYAYDAKRDEYAHAALITLAAPSGRISRYFFGIEYSSKDLRLGLVEASKGRVGSLADQLLLLCYHYDPSTGQYTVATLNLMRAAGALTVLVLAGWILNRLRQERRA